uniref:Uncharacterized protein n=1 Tax=Hemiselmis tepida TaxID=464990 RepID=A0A7S0YYN7_9CRYP|mmetsp:Transcript_31293/g.79421  ORF Transcript_31293/g.79421 Transcript_31293/m.79421 type:complete len:362 (+) Transcript_31293:2-1087(+)
MDGVDAGLGLDGELVMLHGLERTVDRGGEMVVGGRPRSTEWLRATFEPWLVPRNLTDSYHVFISYRQGVGGQGRVDALLTQGLFFRLSREIDVDSNAVRVFLDKRRLERGRNFRDDFAGALIGSRVVVPVVSAYALARMKGLKEGSACDNVLLEWVLSLELLGAGMLDRCMPVMMGRELPVGADGGKLVGDLFVEGDKDELPDVVCLEVVREAERLLRANGVEPSPELRGRTVRQVVADMLLNDGFKAWDVGSAHGGGGETAGEEAHARQGVEKRLVNLCCRSAMVCVRALRGNPVGSDGGKDGGRGGDRASVPPSPPPIEQSTAQDQGGEVERLRLELELERERAKARKEAGCSPTCTIL